MDRASQSSRVGLVWIWFQFGFRFKKDIETQTERLLCRCCVFGQDLPIHWAPKATEPAPVALPTTTSVPSQGRGRGRGKGTGKAKAKASAASASTPGGKPDTKPPPKAKPDQEKASKPNRQHSFLTNLVRCGNQMGNSSSWNILKRTLVDLIQSSLASLKWNTADDTPIAIANRLLFFYWSLR